VKVLTGVADVPVPPKEGETVNRYWQYNNALSGREQAAMAQTLNWMGSIPGAGTFGFSYIAAVLIVMMLIVGPVDWIVLKMMGRQPGRG
jgi:hypothetical protein